MSKKKEREDADKTRARERAAYYVRVRARYERMLARALSRDEWIQRLIIARQVESTVGTPPREFWGDDESA